MGVVLRTWNLSIYHESESLHGSVVGSGGPSEHSAAELIYLLTYRPYLPT